jgi:hypothetical protein
MFRKAKPKPAKLGYLKHFKNVFTIFAQSTLHQSFCRTLTYQYQ